MKTKVKSTFDADRIARDTVFRVVQGEFPVDVSFLKEGYFDAHPFASHLAAAVSNELANAYEAGRRAK